MHKEHTHIGIKILALAIVLPFLYGCQGGGGSSGGSASLSSFAFGSGTEEGGSPSLFDPTSGSNTTTTTTTDGTQQLATLHNPEPATMALLGGGLIGLARLRRKKN